MKIVHFLFLFLKKCSIIYDAMFGTTVSGTFDAAGADDDTGQLAAHFRIRRIMSENIFI